MDAGSVEKSVFAISSRIEILTFRCFREKDRQFVHFSPWWKVDILIKLFLLYQIQNGNMRCLR